MKPLILITNDDGVHAPGIKALIEVASHFGDIFVVAPDSPQSGMGHAVTINNIIHIHNLSHEYDYPIYSCSGTPVDCVKVAVHNLLPRKPDLIISGINHGANSSINVIYSGTMSAAVEGAVMGIPSIGFSLCDHSYTAQFKPGLPFIAEIIEYALKSPLPAGGCLNVNIPNIEKPKGIKICRQAEAHWDEELDERKDPRGGTYFWLTGIFTVTDKSEESDEYALEQGYVSVVPVQFDLTHYTLLAKMRNDFQNIT